MQATYEILKRKKKYNLKKSTVQRKFNGRISNGKPFNVILLPTLSRLANVETGDDRGN